MKMDFKIFYLIYLLKIVFCDKEKFNEIENLLNWAKKKKIYINPLLKLNPTNGEHNLPYFTSKEKIENNTTLISIPEKMLINQNLFTKIFKNNTKSKFNGLWEKLLKIDNPYIQYYSTKELFYMATIIEHFMRTKKGKLYNLFGKYFDLYQYTNLDNFPIFYSKEEIDFLYSTNLYEEIKRGIDSIENEQKILMNTLEFVSADQEAFLKYRVLILSNSINLDNITYVIPFFDLFKRNVFEIDSDAKYTFDNISHTFNITSIRSIDKDKEIIIQMKQMPNKALLMYFGFTCENNNFIGSYYVETLNNLIRKRLNLEDWIKPIMTNYDISDAKFIENIIDTYTELKLKIKEYLKNPIGEYILMKDNLQDYLNLYDRFTDGKYNEVFYGSQKIINVKRIISLEKKLIEIRLKHLNDVINKKINEKKDDL